MNVHLWINANKRAVENMHAIAQREIIYYVIAYHLLYTHNDHKLYVKRTQSTQKETSR